MASARLIKSDGSLDGRFVAHGLEALLPLLDLVHLVDNAVDFDLPRVQVIHRSGELVSLREAADDGDLVTDCDDVSWA